MRALKSLLFWSYLGSTSSVLFLVALGIWAFTAPFDPRRRALHKFTCWWGYHYVQINPFWRPVVIGREKIDDEGCYVIVANHVSMGDILMLFGLKKHFKWVSKASVFKVPFIGWNMWLNDYVSLVRGDRKSIIEMFKACRKHLEQGSSMLLFPEGTRSPDGTLKKFKPGAFTLATQQNVAIVPVVLEGTYTALPKASWVFPQLKPIEIKVSVLDPIHPDTVGGDADELCALVREKMAAALKAQDEAARSGEKSGTHAAAS